jgi:hypothetical protein
MELSIINISKRIELFEIVRKRCTERDATHLKVNALDLAAVFALNLGRLSLKYVFGWYASVCDALLVTDHPDEHIGKNHLRLFITTHKHTHAPVAQQLQLS